MNKILLLSGFLFCAIFHAQIWNVTSFEQGEDLSVWNYSSHTDGATGIPAGEFAAGSLGVFSTACNGNGLYSFGSKFFPGAANTYFELIYTSPTKSNGKAISISFDVKRVNSGNNKIEAFYSINGTDWTLIGTTTNAAACNAKPTYSLGDGIVAAGQDFYCKFKVTSTATWTNTLQLYLDNIKIKQDTDGLLPTTVSLSYPSNGSQNITNRNLVLYWPSSKGADTYNLKVGTSTGASDVVDVNGLTGLNYTLPVTIVAANTNYYVKLTPINNYGSATNLIETTFTTGADAFLNYCGPLVYGAPSTASPYNTVRPITYVNFAGINNISNGNVDVTPTAVAHEDFTAQTAEVTQGSVYPITLNGNTNGYYNDYYTVFIDWNQNGILNDAGEVYFSNGSVFLYNADGTTNSNISASITVPEDAKIGKTRMRVKKEWYSNVSQISSSTLGNPCLAASTPSSGYHGQAEDYTVNVHAKETMSLSEINKKSINIYPNPIKDVLNISSENIINSIVVYNMAGQKLRYAANTNVINLSDLPSGNYIVNVISQNNTQSFKIVKQ